MQRTQNTRLNGPDRLFRSLVQYGATWIATRRPADFPGRSPSVEQRLQLRRLLRTAVRTRFGRDHGFLEVLKQSKGTQESLLVQNYQQAVPIRTYEQLWNEYLSRFYPNLWNLTWPGLIPYFALTSGTTQGATKYIPVSRSMIASNQAAGWSTVKSYLASNPQSRLFEGKMFFLGGSTDLGEPSPGVSEGDLSAIANRELSPLLRPFGFPPLELALDTDWDRKLTRLADQSSTDRITLITGVPSWLLILFQRLLERTGCATIAEVWPDLELVVHGGLKFDPYRSTFEQILGSPQIQLLETYPCSEGFVAFEDLETGLLRLKLDHGIFFEFIPVDQLDDPNPRRDWLGNVEPRINYAILMTTSACLWSHLVVDTIRFESVDPPLIVFTGRTKYTLSAFGEHLISEEVEGAMADAASATGGSVLEWHAGPVFEGKLGYHRFLVEFSKPPDDLVSFRDKLDQNLCDRNADYQAHRVEAVGLPAPSLVEVSPGGFTDWMRSKGKLGGQHKVPRMDNQGTLTNELLDHFDRQGAITRRIN